MVANRCDLSCKQIAVGTAESRYIYRCGYRHEIRHSGLSDRSKVNHVDGDA